MATERIKRRIDRLLDQMEEAADSKDWQEVLELATQVLGLDKENEDGSAFLEMAQGMLEQGTAEDTSANAVPTSGSISVSSTTVAPVEKQIPDMFDDGRYEVKKFLGEGGKKMVYLAHDKTLDREVAFALIKTEGLDTIGLTRVNREAQAMGRLGSHPHIVTVFDLGYHETQPFMVTELMGGGDLEGVIENAPANRLPLEQCVSTAIETCLGLEFAHSKGIIHRDLKPGNLWLTTDGVAKIGDFGLAIASDRSRLTQEGMMVGTVSYMPPEQAMGGEVTNKADLYSLGAMIYEMVTGRPPFLGDNSIAIIGQHINTPPVSPTWHNTKCPKPLEALILRLLSKNPDERPESASDVLTALERIELPGSGEISALPATPDSSEEDSNVLDSVASGVFVGRQQEMGDLKAALEDILSGRGRMLTLVGEPGIGKTRTSQELATYAGLRGAQVLWGRCYEEQGVPAYWPWVQAIRSYVRDADPGKLNSEMGSGAADIADVVSDVRTQLPGLPEAPQLEPEQARFRLFDSITAFLKAASQSCPLLIVLDDIHWADRPSLLLLQFVAREIGNSRLMILGTYRDVDLTRNHPLSESLGELTRERAFQKVLLRGLTHDDVHRFIEVAAGVDPDPGLVNAVFTQTEGNPLFVTEVVRLLVQEGQLDEESKLSTDGKQTESWAVRIPEGVREVIGRRLNRLSKRSNETLTIASILGREFDFEQLKVLVDDLSDDMLLDALEEALSGRVIEEMSETVGRYQFTHALLQETLMDELSLTRRVRLHARIAESLETMYGNRAVDHSVELAFHFEQAQAMLGTEKLVHYAAMAGERALSNSAFEQAQSYFEKCLSARKDAPINEEIADLYFGLGKACVASTTGTPDQVIENFTKAFDYYFESKSVEKAVAVSTFPVPLNLGMSDKKSLDMLENSLTIASSESIEAGRVHNRYALAVGLTTGDYESASDHLINAQSIAESLNDLELQLAVSASGAAIDWFHIRWDSAREKSFRALEFAKKITNPSAEWNATIWALNASVAAGDLSKAQDVAETAVDVAWKLRNKGEVALAHALSARVWEVVGNWNKARFHLTESLSMSPSQTQALLGATLMELQIGNMEEGMKYLSALEAAANSTERGPNLPWAQFGIANLLAYRMTENENHLTTGVDTATFLLEEGGSPFIELIANICVSIATSLDPDKVTPRENLDALESVSGKLFLGQSVDRIIGYVQGRSGNLDIGAQYLKKSVEFTRHSGALVELAWSLTDYVDILTEMDNEDTEEATATLLNEALQISRNLSLKTLMEKILSRREILKA